MRKLLTFFLILASISAFAVAGLFLWQRQAPVRLAFSQGPVQEATSSGELIPRRITLPAVAIDLPVFPGEIKNNRWPVTPDGVIFLSTSPSSNAIIYGHNWPNILGHLKNSQVGDSISVAYTSGLVGNFKVTEVKIVGPNAVEILAPSNDEQNNQLTIYTCTGFLDSKRLVVVASPVNSPPW